MKTWLANLHWTKRLLFSFIALVGPWISTLEGQRSDYSSVRTINSMELTATLIVTALALYWVCKPFISQPSAGE